MADPSRSRARPRVPGGRSAGSPAPRPPALPRIPNPVYPAPGIPANDNARRLLARAMARAAGRLGARALPLLGSALLLYELYQWYFQPGGIEDYEICNTWPPTASGFCGLGNGDGQERYASTASCAASVGCWVGNNTDPAQIGFKPNFIRSGPNRGLFGGGRYNSHETTWQRVGNPAGLPQLKPEVNIPVPQQTPISDPSPLDPPPVPSAVPWIDPLAIPIGAPQPQPWTAPVPAIPARPVEPIGDPSANPEAPARGPGPRPRVRGRRRPGEAREVAPRTGRRQQPSRRAQPPRGEKQRKLIGQLPPGFLSRFINGTTEAADWIDCVWKALPRSYRRGPHTPQQKLQDIYDGWENLNVQLALVNCFREQVEDYIFGRIGRLQATANRRLGVATGSGGPGRNARRGTDVTPTRQRSPYRRSVY